MTVKKKRGEIYTTPKAQYSLVPVKSCKGQADKIATNTELLVPQAAKNTLCLNPFCNSKMQIL